MSVTVWISGATQGLGEALVRTVPIAGARVINLSRRARPDVENVFLDLRDPGTWPAVEASFAAGLAEPSLRRAIYIHNAVDPNGSGMVVDAPPDDFATAVMANVAAPLVLAAAFVRHARAEVDARLALVSSNAAGVPFPGASVYCAGKAAVEQWVKAVREERLHDPRTPSVIAVRPGLVDPPGARQAADRDPQRYPPAAATREALERGRGADPDDVARRMWSAILGVDTDAVVHLGALPRELSTYATGPPTGGGR